MLLCSNLSFDHSSSVHLLNQTDTPGRCTTWQHSAPVLSVQWQLVSASEADDAPTTPLTAPADLPALMVDGDGVAVRWDGATVAVAGVAECPSTASSCALNVTVRSMSTPSGCHAIAPTLELTRTFWVFPAHPGVMRSSAVVDGGNTDPCDSDGGRGCAPCAPGAVD